MQPAAVAAGSKGFGGVLTGAKMVGIGSVASATLVVLTAVLGQMALLSSSEMSGGWAGSGAVVQTALALQSKIWGARSNLYDPADPLMQRVAGYWETYCSDGHGGLCSLATPGNLQCVEFVTAAYWLAGDPLPKILNAEEFWTAYAHLPGWVQIPSPSSFPVTFLPPAPGDLIVWKGGGFLDGSGQEFGHIAIVVGFQPPSTTRSGEIDVAEANGPGTTFSDPNARSNLYRMTVHTDGRIDTWGPYVDQQGIAHSGESVLGFLRHTRPQEITTHLSLPSGVSLNNPLVKYAWDVAQKAGIEPSIFTRQINQESGFNPHALSPVGAIGIAQFMPATAAGISNPLGPGTLNPADPYQSLAAAALYMAAKIQSYGGDYAKAIASYNAGDGGVQNAIAAASQIGGNPGAWQNYLPVQTQQYLQAILG